MLEDGSVRLTWGGVASAGGYNVYRQGVYHATVHTESYVDEKLSRGDYRYEVHAFTRASPRKFWKIAGDLTVKVRGEGSAPPPLAAAAPPAAPPAAAPPALAPPAVAPKLTPELDAPTADPSPPEGGSGGVRQRDFSSRTTEGFTGRLLADGTIRVSWARDEEAAGYNVYRNAAYHTTVHTPGFIDDKGIFDGDYYYEVRSFTAGSDKRFETIATGLTVEVRGLGRTDPNAPKPKQDLLDGYQLVFADEFDTGALDTSKWNTSYLWGPDVIINSELQYYVDIRNDPDFGYDPFTFEDGKLVINSIPTPEPLREKANGQPYLSGVITSYDAFKFTYGYAETRARQPFGKGYWTAFWLLNAYYGGSDPEIDVVEFIGDNQDTAYHTYHYHDSAGQLRSTKSEPTSGIDFTADFHTYGVDWRPGQIVFYIDDIEVHRVSGPQVSNVEMYLLANTALGGWWPGAPDETTGFPGRYEIDYIRVYRQIAPYEKPPLSDYAEEAPPAIDGARPSPGHRPLFELWPDARP